MAVVKVSQKGWVVIPVDLRNKYRWKTGDRVSVVDYGGVVSLVPLLSDAERDGFGALAGGRRPLIAALARARKDARRRERTRR